MIPRIAMDETTDDAENTLMNFFFRSRFVHNIYIRNVEY